MQVIMIPYECFIAFWCLVLNSYIVFSSSKMKALESKKKKKMSKIIYFITIAMMICDLDINIFAGISTRWVYWNLEVANYLLYLLKYLYLTLFTIYVMKESDRFVKVKKVLLALSILIGITGMVCISMPDIREEFYYFSIDNYLNYGRSYDIIRVLMVLDILVLLAVLLLDKRQYRRRTFYLYLGYSLTLQFAVVADYVIDTWFQQD
ncbi:MAG: hypothetical protein ACOCNL_12120, partial [Acetivibrio ethanolgignens]